MLHREEELLAELRAQQTTPDGREQLRERVGVEHRLAHIGQWQGDHARYVGERKNLADVRRHAVVNNGGERRRGGPAEGPTPW